MRLIAFVLALMLAGGSFAAERDRKQRADFVKKNSCPSTGKNKGACPGYVVDHVIALACGGADHPSNMQWQTVEEAKKKDKWERRGCDGKVRNKK